MRKNLVCVICGFLITLSAFAAPSTTYGPTTASDTLWHIANELKPDADVSVQQVMLALFCYNEDAFSSGNINSLEPGNIIKLPSIDEIASIPRDQAYLEVEKQNRQWKKEYLKQPIKHKRSPKTLKSKKIKKYTNANLKQPNKPPKVIASSEQLQQPVVSSPPVQAVQPIIVAAPQPPTPSAQEVAFIAEAKNNLAAIEAKNSMMQTQVAQLNQKIDSLEQNLEQLKKCILDSQKSFWDNFVPMQQYVAKLAISLGKPLFTTLFVGVIILLLLVLFYLFPRRRKSSVVANAPYRDATLAKEEYNFMESKEGVTAKLNLARAYIDMGRETTASCMLSEVLVNGSPSEQAEAKELLTKIKKP